MRRPTIKTIWTAIPTSRISSSTTCRRLLLCDNSFRPGMCTDRPIRTGSDEVNHHGQTHIHQTDGQRAGAHAARATRAGMDSKTHRPADSQYRRVEEAAYAGTVRHPARGGDRAALQQSARP